MFSFKKLAVATVLGLGLFAGSVETASAHHHVCYRQVWKTCWVTKCIPEQICYTAYDECGHPYSAYKTIHRTVSVPVRKLVTVAY